MRNRCNKTTKRLKRSDLIKLHHWLLIKKLPAAAVNSWSVVVNKATTWTHQGNKWKGEKKTCSVYWKLNTRVMSVCVTLNISGKSNLETRIRLLGANAWAGWIRPSSSSSSSPSPCSVFVPWKRNRCEISEGSAKGQVYLTKIYK